MNLFFFMLGGTMAGFAVSRLLIGDDGSTWYVANGMLLFMGLFVMTLVWTSM